MSDAATKSSSPSAPPIKRNRESGKARQAFKIYCAMGVERSIEKLADKVKRETSQIDGWSRTHHWGDRAAAYDLEQAQIRLEQDQHRQKLVDQMLEQRERELYEGMYKQGQKAREQADLMFNFPLTEIRRAVKQDETGRTVEMQIIKPARWSKRDALRFAEDGNAKIKASIEGVRASCDTKEIDIFEDLPLESAKKMPK
jgi:hypothetical protein